LLNFGGRTADARHPAAQSAHIHALARVHVNAEKQG